LKICPLPPPPDIFLMIKIQNNNIGSKLMKISDQLLFDKKLKSCNLPSLTVLICFVIFGHYLLNVMWSFVRSIKYVFATFCFHLILELAVRKKPPSDFIITFFNCTLSKSSLNLDVM
jgi:uncharacterized membrane protein SirB2